MSDRESRTSPRRLATGFGGRDFAVDAIVMSRLGRKADACAALASYASKGFGGWVERAQEIATELGCG